MKKLLVHLSILIGLLAVSATARPCKTLFISSFSFTTTTTTANPNPNLPPSRFFAIVTEIRHQEDRKAPRLIDILENDIFEPDHIGHNNNHNHVVNSNEVVKAEEEDGSMFPSGLFPYDMSSVRDRTKDILSVVVALLFGVGCGALTAATMYLIWSLFFPRYDYYYDEDDIEGGDHSDADDGDVFSPKKYGYVKIPDAESVDNKPATKEVE